MYPTPIERLRKNDKRQIAMIAMRQWLGDRILDRVILSQMGQAACRPIVGHLGQIPHGATEGEIGDRFGVRREEQTRKRSAVARFQTWRRSRHDTGAKG